MTPWDESDSVSAKELHVKYSETFVMDVAPDQITSGAVLQAS